MTLAAPPRPPRPSDPVDRDEFQALIEEARQRARRRRRILGAVGLFALSGVALFLILDWAALSQDASPAPSARPGALAATGSRIAFMRAPGDRPTPWALYVMNADGSGERRLARNGFNLNWSPDRRRIVFQRPENGANSEIYVMNLDGRGLRNLTRHPAKDGLPAWSPDGRRIAFIRWWGCCTSHELRVMNPDGSGQRKLASKLPIEGGYSWSPDGRRIAFTRQLDAGIAFGRQRLNIEIYVMNSDGSGLRNLTRSPGWHDFSPVWSPDGRKIVFSRSRDNLPWAWAPNDPGDMEIYVMNADGSGQRNLTRHPASDWSPVWSPDGRRIAFVSSRGGAHGIYVMSADGSHVRTLVRNVGKEPFPAWSPDGRKIAFTGRTENIYVINTDGGGLQRLTRSPMADWAPVWSP
jgi:Tol biopolymer transport system component